MRNMLLLKKSWLLSLFILLPAIGLTQVAELWVARYNGAANSSDAASSLALDEDGNVYVTGSSIGTGTGFDYATIKYNSAGIQQWEARYNGPGNSDDEAQSLALDADGNVYVTGKSNGSGTGADFATIKYNANGVQQWIVRYNGPGNGDDEALSLAVDNHGHVYVTGLSTGIGTGSDYATIRYNANGVQQWVARYNGPGNDFDAANSLAVDADGNVYITGASTGIGTAQDYATIRYNASGVQQWVARYNGPGNSFDVAHDLAVDASSNVYVTGQSIGGGDAYDYATIKYNNAGNTIWVERYDGPGSFNDIGNAIAVDATGNVYVTGESNMEPFFDPGDPSAAEFATVKYNASGDELWVATYNGPATGFEGALALALDSSGNVYVTGRSRGLVGEGDVNFLDYATIKYNTNGVQQWAVRYNGPGNLEDNANDIAVDDDGNVYVTGFSIGSGTGSDYATIKYSQTVCGNNNGKVLICHKGKKTLCVESKDIEDHLSHGDEVGACPVSPVSPVTARISQSSFSQPELPAHFKVSIFPNPAAVTARVFFELPVNAHVFIKIYDVLGREITTLVNAERKGGFHSAEIDISALQKGLYYCRIVARTKNTTWEQTRKIAVINISL
jgi:uncharacterized delta-60 repeat protein